MRDTRYTRDIAVPPVSTPFRKTLLIEPIKDKLEARRQQTEEIDASFVKALHRFQDQQERQTSGMHLPIDQDTLRQHNSQAERRAFAERQTLLEIPAIHAPVTQESPHIDFCGSLIEYRDPSHRPGYLALTGAVLAYISARHDRPRALVISSDILSTIKRDITSIDGSYEDMFYFRKDAIRVMTEKTIPVWLSLALNGSIPRDIIYAIA